MSSHSDVKIVTKIRPPEVLQMMAMNLNLEDEMHWWILQFQIPLASTSIFLYLSPLDYIVLHRRPVCTVRQKTSRLNPWTCQWIIFRYIIQTSSTKHVGVCKKLRTWAQRYPRRPSYHEKQSAWDWCSNGSRLQACKTIMRPLECIPHLRQWPNSLCWGKSLLRPSHRR